MNNSDISSSDNTVDDDVEELEASLDNDDRKKRKKFKKKKLQRKREYSPSSSVKTNILEMRDTEMHQISEMLSRLSPRNGLNILDSSLLCSKLNIYSHGQQN